MSALLSNQAQLQYVVQWFTEWSEMQRGDFLDILLETCGQGALVNGLVSSLENLACKENPNKPPSLFECRIKVYREWTQNWTSQEKENLLSTIENLDPKFAEKYQERVKKCEKNGDVDNERNEDE
ncbi:uncharacterized protein C14orf119 homolog [Athalia rosae]|uniref:uncharacterized protein C14orf119 homolog n=1 Tax=Athalia rosae TaxID=37344 RepID=UPI0006257997|nr:uncharacterized protein C14orf119 homolog [Athalia rosae]XP_012255231.1 uncharacterized protein C14orf119 homolog [Athalia rosae]